MIQFDDENLSRFRANSRPGKWPLTDLAKKARSVKLKGLGAEVLSQPLDRKRLMALSQNSAVSDRDFFWATIFWGGIRPRNRKLLMASNLSGILDEVGKLRNGHPERSDRAAAYAGMSAASLAPGISGIAPAFFTKLIFFAAPKLNGYILDQWTARSINLISAAPIVRLDHGGYVDKKNTPGTYELFCTALEKLSEICGHYDAVETETRLFGTGGRASQACAWRKYVRSQPPVCPILKKPPHTAHGKAKRKI